MEILTQPTQLKMMMQIMKNRKYRFLFTVILGFCFFCSVAEASQIELVDFLKSKYLGKKIYQRSNTPRQSIQLRIVNVIEEEDRFYAVLSNYDKVLFSFKTSLEVNPQISQNNFSQKTVLDFNVLKTEELINKGIQKTLSDSNSSTSLSTLSNFENNMDSVKPRNDFTTSKEIIYTNIRSNKEVSDYFIVTYQGLFLSNGTRIQVLIK
jgi:hypothetical protein